MNYLRKGRRQFRHVSLDAPLSQEGGILKDVIPDPKADFLYASDSRLTIDDIKNKGLTAKELKVLSLLIKGYTVREIAKLMNISHVMVVKHKKNIIRKARLKGYQKQFIFTYISERG